MNWKIEENKLYRKFQFPGFKEAIAFMQSAVKEIESLDHHPEWKNVYSTVEVWLCTHSAGNTITKKDYALAEILDNLYSGT